VNAKLKRLLADAMLVNAARKDFFDKKFRRLSPSEKLSLISWPPTRRASGERAA
jgi:hypothetical protein